MKSKTRQLLATTAALLGALALSACGGAGDQVQAPRPVLVTHPAPGAGAAAAAFAGEVRARQESELAFRVGGKLVSRAVDVGDTVSAGEVLAELDPGDLRLQAQAAQAQLAAAEGELARTRADRARYAKLADQQLVSRSTMDAQNAAYAAAAGQTRAARANLDVARNQAAYTRLRAPRDGRIATRKAEVGQVVGAGQVVFTLAGSEGREVAIDLPESSIRRFRVGQPALVELWSDPGRRLPGTIREIAPAADPQTRTYAARVALAGGSADAVELGQSARVYIQSSDSRSSSGQSDHGATDAALTVPLAAIQRGANDVATVWVVDPKTRKLHATPVRLGTFGEDSVPVKGDITIDDWIVAAGGHLLREGEPVTPVDRDNRPVMTAPAPYAAD